jgi:hypothetical protein
MEFNKEVTSASSGLVYVCFGSFVKCSRVLAIAGKNLISFLNIIYFYQKIKGKCCCITKTNKTYTSFRFDENINTYKIIKIN